MLPQCGGDVVHHGIIHHKIIPIAYCRCLVQPHWYWGQSNCLVIVIVIVIVFAIVVTGILLLCNCCCCSCAALRPHRRGQPCASACRLIYQS